METTDIAIFLTCVWPATTSSLEKGWKRIALGLNAGLFRNTFGAPITDIAPSNRPLRLGSRSHWVSASILISLFRWKSHSRRQWRSDSWSQSHSEHSCFISCFVKYFADLNDNWTLLVTRCYWKNIVSNRITDILVSGIWRDISSHDLYDHLKFRFLVWFLNGI